MGVSLNLLSSLGQRLLFYIFIGFSGEVVGGGGREVDNGVWARNEASLSTATNDMNLTQEFDRKAILHAQVSLSVRTTGNGGAH